jgi:hypothetical protein
MVHITNTTHNLGNFAVRDENLSYDNEYNEALLAAERSQALRMAAEQAISATVRTSLNVAKKVGTGLVNGLERYIESAQA